MKSTTLRTVVTILVTFFCGIGVVYLASSFGSATAVPPHDQPITGKTWTWAKLMTKPARVEIPTDGPQVIYLCQAEFQVSDTATKTAFVDTRVLFPAGGFKVGDEVLIAEVPSRDDSSIGYRPTSTYFVIDYRKAGTTNSVWR